MGLHGSFAWVSRAGSHHHLSLRRCTGGTLYEKLHFPKNYKIKLWPCPHSQHWEFHHWIQREQGQTVREVHLYSKEIESSISLLLEFSRKNSYINIGRVTERQLIRSVTPFQLVWQLHLFRVKLISTVIWGDEVHIQYCNLEDLYKAKIIIHTFSRKNN